jgi:2,4-dienoyl-CoA reductase-like NADH-dependent reductase (Old Yellow Enzyme family)
MVAFGRSYIANPGLFERLVTGAPLAKSTEKPSTPRGRTGYSDYPTIRHAAT